MKEKAVIILTILFFVILNEAFAQTNNVIKKELCEIQFSDKDV